MTTRMFVIQLKIISRYSGVWYLFTGASFALGMFLYVSYQQQHLFNIPLTIAIAGCMLFGPMFSEAFVAGRRELMTYSLMPGNLKKVLLLKLLIWWVYMALYIMAFFLISLYLYTYPLSDYIDAFYLLATALPVLITLGNRLSIMPRRQSEGGLIFLYMFLTPLASVIPYALLYVWLKTPLLCVIFSVCVLLLWYIRFLPASIKRLHTKGFHLK